MPIDKRLNVLLLEDEPDNAIAFEMSREDWNITRFSHPSLVDINTINDYDVVFVDMVYNVSKDDISKLPSSWVDMGVLEPAERLIKTIIEKNPNFPIILMTALSQNQISKYSNILELEGKFLYIEKPVNLGSDSFNVTVNSFIDKTLKKDSKSKT